MDTFPSLGRRDLVVGPAATAMTALRLTGAISTTFEGRAVAATGPSSDAWFDIDAFAAPPRTVS